MGGGWPCKTGPREGESWPGVYACLPKTEEGQLAWHEHAKKKKIGASHVGPLVLLGLVVTGKLLRACLGPKLDMKWTPRKAEIGPRFCAISGLQKWT